MAQCPAAALADESLPAGARVVLAVLWSYAGRETRFVWPSRPTLAQASGTSERTLRRHLAALKQAGWVIEAEGANGRPGWSLCDPPGVEVHRADEEVDAAISDRSEPAKTGQSPAISDRSPAKTDRSPANPDRPKLATRPKLTAKPANPDRPYSMEPTKNTLSQRDRAWPKLAAVPDARRDRDHALARFRELVWDVTPPDGCGMFVSPPQPVYDLLDQGQTPEDIIDVLRKAVERINAGDLEARMWGAPLLKGWYGPIRDSQPIGRNPAKPKGPQIETPEEALAWAKTHGNRLPEGWGWTEDGRGNFSAVRERGAS